MMLNIKDKSEQILSYFLYNNIYVKKGQEINLLQLLIDFNNYGSNFIRHYIPEQRLKDEDILNYIKETNLINNDPFEFFPKKLKHIELAFKLHLIENSKVYTLKRLLELDKSLSAIIKKNSIGLYYIPDNIYNRKLQALYPFFYYLSEDEKNDIISYFNSTRSIRGV